jgi:hypothetical protein
MKMNFMQIINFKIYKIIHYFECWLSGAFSDGAFSFLRILITCLEYNSGIYDAFFIF